MQDMLAYTGDVHFKIGPLKGGYNPETPSNFWNNPQR